MKFSNFNYVLDLGNIFVFYNLLTKVLFLKENLFFSKEEKKQLIQWGFIVDEKINELSQAETFFKTAVEDKSYLSLTVIPTFKCNLKCTYCYQQHFDSNILDFNSFSTGIIKYISANPSLKDVHIEWFGGEPSLHTSNIFEVISRLKRYCILKKINLTNSINTNLFRVSKSDFEYYKNGDMDQIVTTLAGWKDSHDYYRKDFFQLSTYEKTLENIKKVHEFLPVSICINITRKSMENIDKLINDLNLLNKNNITLTFLRVSDTGISNITKGEILEPVEYIDFLSKLVIKLLVNNFHIALESNFTGKALYCGTQHLDSFTILPNNSITKCVDNCSTDNSIGYIDSRGMHLDEELLKSKLTNPYINKTCKQCFWIPYCNGGCQYCREKKISFCPDEIIDFNTFLYLFVLICMKEKQSVLFKKLLDLNVDNFRRVNFDKIEFI